MPKSVPPLLSDRLAVAMSHPTRLYALTVLAERTATPGEIAEGLDLELNRVMHHIKVLEKLEMIELVDIRRAAGGRVKEQLWRAKSPAYVDDRAWQQMSDGGKLNVTFSLLRMISGDLGASVASGAFFDPDNNHLSRNPMRLDGLGWQEVVEYLDSVVDGLKEIQARVDERTGGDELLDAKVEILQFRSPPPLDRNPKS